MGWEPVTLSEPEDDRPDEEEDQTEVDDYIEDDADGPDDYELNWPLIHKSFFQNTHQMQLFAIGFVPSSAVDRSRLYIAKKDRTEKILYTASFFVKERDVWYIYNKILVLSRHISSDELPEIYKRLERNAYVQSQFMRTRRKHLLEYLEIVL